MIKEINTPPEIKKILKEIKWSSNNEKLYTFVRDEKGYIVQEHRLVWEQKYGKIPKGGVIHHINENKKDNRIENLMLFPSPNAHLNFHKQQRLVKLARESK
jgi:hypothetical protein